MLEVDTDLKVDPRPRFVVELVAVVVVGRDDITVGKREVD